MFARNIFRRPDLAELKKFKLRYTSDEAERKKLQEELVAVQKYCKILEEEALKGSDSPEASSE